VLIIETTRGATERDSDYEREEEIDRLLHAMADTLHQGGSVLIPVFALGRMQEMIRVIHDARTARLLPECPVTCSGLGMDLFNYFDTIARKTGLIQFNRKWLHELKVKPLRATLVPGKDPGEKGIFLLSSGMLVEHTPSYAAAASMLAHPHNLIAFVGYCDPDTPGGRLLDTPQNDSFLFEQLDYVTEVRARIERFDLSGHADRDELIDFALETDPRCVVLTHGDPPAREWFNETLEERAPHIQRVDPIPGKTYVV
jgi:predicted metal-dependent RNase